MFKFDVNDVNFKMIFIAAVVLAVFIAAAAMLFITALNQSIFVFMIASIISLAISIILAVMMACAIIDQIKIIPVTKDE